MIFLALLALTDVRGERILLLTPEEDELSIRMRDELIADGFDVIVRDERDLVDVMGSAVAIDAVAVVSLHGPRIDVWCTPAHPDHAVLDASLVDKEAVAVRTAEIVRAHLIAPLKRDHPPPIVAATAPHHDDVPPLGFEATMAFGANGASAGLPVTGSLDATLGLRFDDMFIAGLNASAVSLTSPARVTAPDGSADVNPETLRAFFAVRLPLNEDWELVDGVSVGAVWIHGVGRSAKGTGQHDADAVVSTADASLTLRYAIGRPVWIFGGLDGGVLAPTPAVVLGSSTVPLGPFVGSLVVGAAFVLDPL